MIQAAAVAIGFAAGVLSGFIGIGGGVVMIPALVFVLGYHQRLAQGTTLAAMVLPIGIFAAWEYWKSGDVNVRVALLIALGFLAGGYFGAKYAVNVDEVILRKVFGVLMFALSIKLIFFD
ncbi:MAG: sulfite exporter TauE/SafE family protein [Spirochaetes bacterium]|nr:sulfite exporter TauE/SafE family protein [Spirochaetota bacterium]HPA71620.1 sulfite exporter TauE/SafE family protein [Spirochaetota bacterium]